jgi:anti-repressor protein
MNELIVINYEDNRMTVSGRELHASLGVETDYPHWFARMCEYGFDEGDKDYKLVSQICPTNNPKNPTTTRTDHLISIPMAKELCMIQRSEMGKKFRQYFIAAEEAWNTPEMLMARSLKYASSRIEALEASNTGLVAQVDAMRPKALFADAVSASDTTILVGELAKILRGNGLDIGQTRLFQRLRDEGFLIRRNGSDRNMPTQRSVDMGLFRIKETAVTHASGYTTIVKTPKITGRGQEYFINYFLGKSAPAVVSGTKALPDC